MIVMEHDFEYQAIMSQDSAMDLFDDGSQFFNPMGVDAELEDDDILANVSSASMLASQNLSADHMEPLYTEVPQIMFQAPTRTNTAFENASVGGTIGPYRSWNPLVVGADEAQRDAAQQDVVVSMAASMLPSDAGTSQTSFIDSGFVSQQWCEICKFVYKSNCQRKKHILRHIKPYICEYTDCKKHTEGFATTNDLVRHDQSVHKNGLKTWWKCAMAGCQTTDKSHCFDRRDNFVAHIKRKHKDLNEEDTASLVSLSARHPTPQEIQEAKHAKNNRQPRRAASARGPNKKSRGRTRRVKSEISSVCSVRTSNEDTLHPMTVLPEGAPAFGQSTASNLYGMMDEFALMGGGAEAPCLQAAPNSNEADGITCKTEQALYLDPINSFHDSATAISGPSAVKSAVWYGKQPASPPQTALFPTLSQQEYLAQRTFGSNLSVQRNFEMNQCQQDAAGLQQMTAAYMPDMSMVQSIQSNNALYAGQSVDFSLDQIYRPPIIPSISTLGEAPSYIHKPTINEALINETLINEVIEGDLENMHWDESYDYLGSLELG